MMAMASSRMTDERLRWHMENWAVWMDRDADGTGFMRYASGGMGLSHGSNKIEKLENEADARCARAVDAIVSGLPERQRWSVHHFNLAAVYRFRGDPAEQYAAALEAIRRGLDRRGIY